MIKHLYILLFVLPTLLFSQNNTTDSIPMALDVVEIAATRLTLTENQSPLAVTVLTKKRLQTATQQLSPYEVLSAIPGVFAMNPDNFSQDLRISIRGFGARSAFGIRGIRLFTDGLPEGTPDGQADVDNLDMGIIRQMEVLRGAASCLYGNASGGVIYMLTENPTTRKPLLEAQTSFGSYGFQRYQLKLGQKLGKFLYFINGSYNNTEGYRAWSSMQNTILNGKAAYQFNESTRLTILANYGNSPTANDPGALTTEKIKTNRQQADSTNLLFETGEAVTQSRVGATFDTKFKQKHSISARTFYTSRRLLNRLPIAANGYGDLKRNYYGGSVSYQLDEKFGDVKYRLKVGIDLENQEDRRQRYAYLKTIKDGVTKYSQDKLALDQLESFQSTGIYLLQDLQPTNDWLVSLGIRFDDLNLKATDYFLSNGDQSGSRHFTKVNPMLGISYSFTKKASVYANFSTTYESPTLNELSNNPDNSGGFNPTLKPQAAQSFEIGTKGNFTEGGHFDIALFRIETQNDLVPYQITGQTGKTFYRNAGKTLRKGVEFGLNYPIRGGVTAYYTLTVSDFKYETYSVNTTSFDGKVLPGIPKTHTQLELRYTPKNGFYAIIQGRYVAKVQANDANTAAADAYSLLNIRLGHVFSIKTYEIEPFLGVNNVTNTAYIANVQINAQSNRYFEPAALRYFFGGVKFRLK